MARRKHHRHHVPRSEERRGLYGGVYGTSYAISGGYLNADQFGYTTAQAADAGANSSSGGDAGAGAGGAA